MRTFLAVAIVLGALPILGEDSFPDVEYVSGKGGFARAIKGSLAVTASEVTFKDSKGHAVFAIPVSQLVEASHSREREEGSFGRKMALGIFASHTDEFLRVETKSSDTAEVIVFKTKKEKSPGMVAPQQRAHSYPSHTSLEYSIRDPGPRSP
jgi:hypothetical protein